MRVNLCGNKDFYPFFKVNIGSCLFSKLEKKAQRICKLSHSYHTIWSLAVMASARPTLPVDSEAAGGDRQAWKVGTHEGQTVLGPEP